jgi:hypothetical protein
MPIEKVFKQVRFELFIDCRPATKYVKQGVREQYETEYICFCDDYDSFLDAVICG